MLNVPDVDSPSRRVASVDQQREQKQEEESESASDAGFQTAEEQELRTLTGSIGSIEEQELRAFATAAWVDPDRSVSEIVEVVAAAQGEEQAGGQLLHLLQEQMEMEGGDLEALERLLLTAK